MISRSALGFRPGGWITDESAAAVDADDQAAFSKNLDGMPHGVEGHLVVLRQRSFREQSGARSQLAGGDPARDVVDDDSHVGQVGGTSSRSLDVGHQNRLEVL